MTMTAEPQTFEEAVARFEVFLKENGYSVTLIWVEPADLVLPGRRAIYVRVPVPSRNLEHARMRFVSGMTEGLGVTFGTICDLPNATCCYAWVPKDRKQQQEHLMGPGLKISAKTDSSRVPGIYVANAIRWQLLKLRYRNRTEMTQDLFG
jgi:hypothetical protein